MMPRSSGTVRTPSIVNVFPVPVWPYAKIVPVKRTETRTLSQRKGLFTQRLAAFCVGFGHRVMEYGTRVVFAALALLLYSGDRTR